MGAQLSNFLIDPPQPTAAVRAEWYDGFSR